VSEIGDPRASTLWALLPAKCFARAKSRLGEVLSDPLRRAFARGLFEHVLGTLQVTPGVAEVLVLTDDDEVEALARARAARVLRDLPGARLHAIVDRGLAHAGAAGAGAALICMADLPHLESAQLGEVIEALRQRPIVIAPDVRAEGTNLLALAPPTRFGTCFGRADSFQQHLAQARAHGEEAHVVRAHGLCFDVDEPGDLDELARHR
jgi:2-phospho-L-lactate guanylyltransferase